MAKPKVDTASQTRRRRNSKPEARVSDRHLLVWQPPEMRSAEDAIRYLGGDFADTLFALSEVMMSGHTLDPSFVYDLGNVAENVAEFLAKPEPTRFESEAAEHTAELSACVEVLKERMKQGFHGKDASGDYFDVGGESLPLLARALAAASLGLETHALCAWDEEMKAREAMTDARCEVERLEKGGLAEERGAD